MTEMLALFAMMLWLGLGGWAFRWLGPDTERNLLPAVFVACVLFGPFVFGAAIADRRESRRGQP